MSFYPVLFCYLILLHFFQQKVLLLAAVSQQSLGKRFVGRIFPTELFFFFLCFFRLCSYPGTGLLDFFHDGFQFVAALLGIFAGTGFFCNLFGQFFQLLFILTHLHFQPCLVFSGFLNQQITFFFILYTGLDGSF